MLFALVILGRCFEEATGVELFSVVTPDGGQGVDGPAKYLDDAACLETVLFGEGGVLRNHAGRRVVGVEAQGFLVRRRQQWKCLPYCRNIDGTFHAPIRGLDPFHRPKR